MPVGIGNQISNTGYSHDAAGNRTADPAQGTFTDNAAGQTTGRTNGSSSSTYTWGGGDQNELVSTSTAPREGHFGEVHLFVGPNFVVTVRHGNQPDLGTVRTALESEPDFLSLWSEAALTAILNAIVDCAEPARTARSAKYRPASAACSITQSESPSEPTRCVHFWRTR